MATCRGIDVSAYQGTQDWASRKAEGVVFAFAKASEGQTSRDGRFGTHIRGILAAGLVPGAYHFAWPNQNVAAEAANYIAAVKPYAGAGFVHWLDLERYTDGRNYTGRTAAQIREWVTSWLAAVRTAFPGQRVGVYTSADDVANGHVPADVPLWYPAYPWGPAAYSRAEAAAQPKVSGRTPLLWQFTSQPIDRNICYLSAADLRAWAAGTEENTVTATDDYVKALRDNLLVIESLAEKDAKGQPAKHGAGYFLAHIQAQLAAVQATEAAQTAAITALAKLVGTEVDTAAVVAAVQKAIADAVVKVSVDVTGPQGA